MRTYIKQGLLQATKIGRSKLVQLASLERLLALGTDVVRAMLFHAANERTTEHFTTPELEVQEAAAIAKHRAAIASAKLRKTREHDLAMSQPGSASPANSPAYVLPEITDQAIHKFAVLAGAISREPLSQWSDDQIRSLLRAARMAEGRSLPSTRPDQFNLPPLPPPPPPPPPVDDESVVTPQRPPADPGWSL